MKRGVRVCLFLSVIAILGLGSGKFSAYWAALPTVSIDGASDTVSPQSSLAPRWAGLAPADRIWPLTGRAAEILPGGWNVELSVQRMQEVSACFAEGSSPELVAMYEQMLAGNAGPLAYFLGGRWPGGQGDPTTLTWSFMADGVNIPAGVGEPAADSNLFATMNLQFAGNTALWISLFEQSFARWGAVTGINYVRITDSGNEWDDGAPWGSDGSATRGDVRIGMKFIDGGSGSNVLAYNYFPGSGGDMVFDSSNVWTDPTNNYRFLRNVILHEHGHGLGMFHVCPAPTGGFGEPTGARTKLMEPFLATNFDGPQHDDIRAGHRHYGDPFEDDNSPGLATDLGTLIQNTPTAVGLIPAPAVNHGAILSIDADGEQDYFAFAIAEASSLTVTVVPRGLNYDSSPQVSGNCTTGNLVNSLTMADLNVELIADDGNTVLNSAAANPAGTSEMLFSPVLAAGNYFVRVFEANAPAQPQLYELTLTSAPPTPNPAALEVDGMRKNRYVSFSPNNPGTVAAFRVNKITAPTGSCFVGMPDAQGRAACVDSPVFRVWTEAVVHVGDCEIVPVANYEIRSTLDGTTFTPPLSVATIALPSNNNKLWGDVTGAFDGLSWPAPDAFSNVHDVLAVLARIGGVAPILVSFERANVQAISAIDPCLNAFVNTADLFIVVKAVAGDPYPFINNPTLCPACP